MIDFGKWAFANRKLVYFVVAVLLVGGILSAYDMSKLEDPEIKVKLAMVIATRPGASAHEMELEVTDPLEKNIRTMGEVESVTSSSFNDLAILEVELKSTVRDADVEQCWDMLRRKASDVQRRLPSGTSVVVQDDFGLVYGMLYALTGDGLTERQLSDYAGLLKRELGDLDGVARVEIYGEREECIDISILPEKMAMLGVSPAEALATLNGQNNVYYAGYYDNGPDRIRVAVADKFRAVKEIESMVIQGHEDDQLRLCDIARVEHGYAEPVRNEMSYEGQRALGIAVAAASGSDIVKVGAEVERCLAELQAERFPAGVACHKIFYQPERVKDALGTFLINLIESVVIVVAILMLTMGFRSGMIIGISLVVTVVGSFLILGMADGTMQRVSLAAFILAMGMLVDNAIVIVDGILIDLKLGKPRREAMTAIGRKTAMPLLGATLIAILSFLPIFLSPDTAGVYVRDLFIVLAVSLLLSWVLALVHVPLMADAWLGQPAAPAGGATLYDSAVYRWLRAALGFGLRHRWSSIAVALVLVGLSVWGYGYMRQGFFPDMVYDQLYMEYKLPEVCLITTDWEPRIPVLNIDYDQSAARRMGLSRQDIAVSMLSAAGGIPVGAFYEGTHKNTIYLKCTEADGKPVDNLENVPVFPMMPNLAGLFDEELLLKLKSGAIDRSELLESVLHTVPLKQVSRGVQVEWEDPVVPRYNGQRAQRVMCSPAPGIETEAARLAVAERIEAIPLPSGYALSWEGEKGASDETMRYLFKNVPLGVVLMIAILILLFGDYRKPAVILCCIPLLGIGVVGAMLLTGKVFTFCAIVGALGLVGMMMKNCIVLMDEIGAQIAAGADPASALVSSSESRLRPVMMASLTTILGMIPLLGDAMFGSMAATIMGGLLFSTFATLFFVPILYALFFKIRIDR